MTLIVTKKAVREFVRDALDGKSFSWQTTGDVSNVSAVVDPSAALTNPGDGDFKPSNRAELKASLSALVDEISDDDTSAFYTSAKKTVEDIKSEEEQMKKEDVKVEEAVRHAVKKILREFGPHRDTGLSYSGPAFGGGIRQGFEECEACEGEGMLDDGSTCKACKGKGAIPSTKKKNKMMTDVGGATFEEIAKELGYAGAPGARQAVEKAIEKAKTVFSIDPDELEILTLQAMNEYVEYLKKSGELTPADVELMKSHPSIIAGLDGFRNFFSAYMKKHTDPNQKIVNPFED